MTAYRYAVLAGARGAYRAVPDRFAETCRAMPRLCVSHGTHGSWSTTRWSDSMGPVSPNPSRLDRPDFRQAAHVPLGAAEASGQKRLDEQQREPIANHSSTEAEDIHVVILDSLARGEHVVDQPSANAGDLVRNNARADAAAANRDAPFDIARSDRSGEGNYDSPDSHPPGSAGARRSRRPHVPAPPSFGAISVFSAKPPWSEAIPMRIAVTPDIEFAARMQGTTRPRLPYSAASGAATAGALATIAANSSLFRLAPPTRAPPTSGSARIARALDGLTEPP